MDGVKAVHAHGACYDALILGLGVAAYQSILRVTYIVTAIAANAAQAPMTSA